MRTIDNINDLNKSDFLSLFGNVFEKTESVALNAFELNGSETTPANTSIFNEDQYNPIYICIYTKGDKKVAWPVNTDSRRKKYSIFKISSDDLFEKVGDNYIGKVYQNNFTSPTRTRTGDGGGGSFFYRGGELLVAVGGGGGGGQDSAGGPGDGGGIGAEPDIIATGYFPFNGNTGDMPTANITARQGGQVARCTIGNYWANQGIAPCVSIGSTTFFTGQNGQKSTSIFTTPVIRGYKAGVSYQFNGGNGQFSGDGGGGGGSQGGNGGNIGGQGGDGGSGFAAIPIDSATIGGHVGMVGTIKIEKV